MNLTRLLWLLLIVTTTAFNVSPGLGVIRSRGVVVAPIQRSFDSPAIQLPSRRLMTPQDLAPIRPPSTNRIRLLIFALWRFLVFPYKLVQRAWRDESTTAVIDDTDKLAEETDSATIVLDADIVEPQEAESFLPATDEVVVTAPATISAAQAKTLRNEPRWGVGTVDLSGNWTLVVDQEFRLQYDNYLKNLGQPLVVRGLAIRLIGITTEQLRQEGSDLWIRGSNAQSVWERTLVASGSMPSQKEYEPFILPTNTADNLQQLESEAWWEKDGTEHISWMRKSEKYGGGSFSSKRFLEGEYYICEATFHPDDATRPKAHVTWRFQRDG